VIYRDELGRLASGDEGLRVVHTLTRSHPPGWPGPTRRIDPALLADAGIGASEKPHVFVCGPTSLVEAAARALLTQGHDRTRIKTERFGPTGG
jgi:ferredoxin-NADP reductase